MRQFRNTNMRNVLTVMLAAALLLALPAPSLHAQNRPATQETTPQEEMVYRVTQGKADDVKLLLSKISNPNMIDRMGWPILSIAASRTDEEGIKVVKVLVEAGADVNFDGGTRNYPIMFAVQSGNAETVKYLLGKGADYRVKDAYGVKVVDFARAGRNTEVRELISSAIEKDIDTLSRKRSQEYLDEVTHRLAYHSCALQYYGFYYKSRQDPIPLEEQERNLNQEKEIVGKSISELMMMFRVQPQGTMDVFNAAKNAIYSEMENLISNRWRRIKGVGKPGDMEERCTRIAEPYKEGVFDKEELDKEL